MYIIHHDTNISRAQASQEMRNTKVTAWYLDTANYQIDSQ